MRGIMKLAGLSWQDMLKELEEDKKIDFIKV